MTHEPKSMSDGLAQIIQEEAQLSFGINRYFLGIASAVLFFAGLFLVTTEYGDTAMDRDFYGIIGPFIMVLSVFSTFGTWRAIVVHKKLKALQTSSND